MLSSSLGDDAIAQIEEDITTLVKGIYVRMLLPDAITRLPIIPGNRRYSQAGRRTRRILTEVIAQRRAAGAGTGDDLLSNLLAARDVDGDGQGMSETELIDQVTTFHVAGSETTATTLAWALSLASRHPGVASALFEEARTAVAGTTATWEDLPRLTYTRNTFTEALRLYPPAWLLTRTTTNSIRLGDYAIPAGATLAYRPLHHRSFAQQLRRARTLRPQSLVGRCPTHPAAQRPGLLWRQCPQVCRRVVRYG